jgi:hypothetical protein
MWTLIVVLVFGPAAGNAESPRDFRTFEFGVYATESECLRDVTRWMFDPAVPDASLVPSDWEVLIAGCEQTDLVA